MKATIAILLALAACVAARQVLIDPLDGRDHRIVGGVEADKHEFPSITNEGSHSCGATLVGKRWALTAAHCLNVQQVVAGDHNIRVSEGTELRVSVKKNHMHPNYQSPNRYSNDAGLLELSAEIEFNDKIQPAKLARRDFNPTSGDSIVVGWGTQENGQLSDVLKKVTVPLVNPQACALAYPGSIDDSMICAGIADKDSCQGDSGGPLFCTNENGERVHCGIVSWGRGCGLDGYPGVYGRTAHFCDWIEQITEGEVNCDEEPAL